MHLPEMEFLLKGESVTPGVYLNRLRRLHKHLYMYFEMGMLKCQ